MKPTDAPALHDIRISVETEYIAAQSEPARDRYAFAYTVTIENRGGLPAKLLTRHWIITDAGGRTIEVRGDGVIGEQPYLRPGEGFRYTSGTVIDTPVGRMHGSYHLIDDDGTEFDAPIPAFTLAVPRTLH